jgi:uncharacterized protein YegL
VIRSALGGPVPDNSQKEFVPDEFVINPEQRCACVLLLDTSSSMSGRPIQELNEGLAIFREDLASDTMAMKRVEIAIVSFGPLHTVQEFVTPGAFVAPQLQAKGDTPMGAAILRAIEMVSERKTTYRKKGISYYRPWIFLITDGAPTDAWAEAARQIQAGEQSKAFSFFAVGVEGANMGTLRQISVREPLALRGLQFRSLFSWLTGTLRATSRSSPGDEVPFVNPTAPNGWASIT